MMATTNSHIEQREQRIKLKKSLRVKEMETSNKLLSKNLANTNDICKIVDAVYVMENQLQKDSGKIKKENR